MAVAGVVSCTADNHSALDGDALVGDSSIPPPATAQALFHEDFEAPLGSAPQPVWRWSEPFDPVAKIFGMMYGPGDMFERSSVVARTGTYSLRLNFEGRNGVCNMCGPAGTLEQHASQSDLTYFVDAAGTDLAASPYLEPDPLRYVYNRSDRWSRWIPSALSNQNATNDRLAFVGDAPDLNAMGGVGRFNAGDDVLIYRKCGVDGSVGANDVDRRSDCDLAINYFNNITPTVDHPLSGSLFRRFYVYIPSSTTLPETTFKLGYIHWDDGGQVRTQVLVLSIQRGVRLESDGPLGFLPTSLTFQRDTWYYVEEQFQRESAAGAADGAYRLWSAPAGTQATIPLVERMGISIGQILGDSGGGMSFGGNWQHHNDAAGYVYFDDLEVSKAKIGP